jgi:hypothetical protein
VTGARLALQRVFEAMDECVRLEGLAEKADRAACKGPSLQIWIVARRDHDDRHRALDCREVLFEFDATHARHLDIRNDAGKASNGSASEELLGGCEAARFVARRSDQGNNSAAHRIVVVYDGYQRSRRHAVPFP